MAGTVDDIIGWRVRCRRRELNLTLQALASRVGVGFQQVQRYERGQCRIWVGMLVRLASALDVEVSYFFEGLPPEPGCSRRVVTAAPSPPLRKSAHRAGLDAHAGG